jgi:Tol biopolymer transport system component
MFARRPLVLLTLVLVALAAVSTAHAAFPGPNGRIVFSSDREATSISEIYSAAPDGSDVKRLTWSPDDVKQNPTWSPDGTKIAYEAISVSFSQDRFHIFVMNSDGSDQRLVSPDVDSTSDDREPAWSPDGTQIAFSSTRGGILAIWVMNADGSGLHRLNAFGMEPAWSPDGAHIAYVGGSALREVNADGSGDHLLAAVPAGAYVESPDWSPDGSRLVFAQANPDGPGSTLYSIAADGSDRRQLTSGAFADFRASWSPDGSKIVFDRQDPVTGNRQLHVMNADGSGESQLMSSVRDDMSGGWGTSTESPIVVVPGGPDIHFLSPVDGGTYLSGGGDIAIYFCTSEISVVVSCDGNLALGEPLDPTPGTHRLTVVGTDVDGRQSIASVSYTTFVPDRTAPTIAIDTPADGATYVQGANVTVHYSCSDEPGGSGIGVCNGPVPDTAPLDTSNVGTFRFTVSAVDQAGNRSSATSTYQVVDRTPPTISITTPGDHAVYVLGQSVLADYTCADQTGGSGLASCAGPVAAGAAIDTSSVGDKTFAITATDRAGNVAHASRSYSVVYDFTGFLAPVSAAYPASNPLPAGEAIPFKFRLHGNQGLDVLAAGSPVWAPCGGGDATPARGSLSYNPSNDRYTYLVATDKAWSGTCRDLVLTLRDGTSHRARIAFG